VDPINIHPKSRSPGSPDSANYLNFPQNYSLKTRKLPTLLCWIFFTGSKSCKDVSKCCGKYHKCLINMFLVSDSLFLQHYWDFLMIYAPLSRDFDVKIYALFPQIFCDWKADSANFIAFRMCAYKEFLLPLWWYISPKGIDVLKQYFGIGA